MVPRSFASGRPFRLGAAKAVTECNTDTRGKGDF